MTSNCVFCAWTDRVMFGGTAVMDIICSLWYWTRKVFWEIRYWVGFWWMSRSFPRGTKEVEREGRGVLRLKPWGARLHCPLERPVQRSFGLGSGGSRGLWWTVGGDVFGRIHIVLLSPHHGFILVFSSLPLLPLWWWREAVWWFETYTAQSGRNPKCLL